MNDWIFLKNQKMGLIWIQKKIIHIFQFYLLLYNLAEISAPTWQNLHMESTEYISFIAIVTSTSLFGMRKCTSFTDGNHITINILSSVLCQEEICAKQYMCTVLAIYK